MAVNGDFTPLRECEPDERGYPSPPNRSNREVLAACALLRCRETPGDVMPEPGTRYRSPWSRELMERNAKRAREGGR